MKGCPDLDCWRSQTVDTPSLCVPRIASSATIDNTEDADQDPLEQLVNRFQDLNQLERQSSNISVLTNKAYYAFGEAYSKALQVGQTRRMCAA